jgi:SAM-dependent methyltransferase
MGEQKMRLRTLASLIVGGQLGLLRSIDKAADDYYRVVFLAAGLRSGWLARLAHRPLSLERLATELEIAAEMRAGLEAWLIVGVALGELRREPDGYAARGKLARALTDARNDAAAAMIEEMATLHRILIMQSPQRLAEGERFALAEQDAGVVARSSRLFEPFIGEAVAGVVPERGAVRLLEIGCGAGANILSAARRNEQLTALGIELQAEAAAMARKNVALWRLEQRVSIETGDIRQREPDASFDLATLHQNIYYFPVGERTGLLRHVRGFLKPGGRLLLTTLCQGPGATVAVLDLWGAMTAGCGRLPERVELANQMGEAGFGAITSRSLIPGQRFYAFVGVNA